MVAEPELVDYIKKAKGIGQADSQTRDLLSKNGWSVTEINEAFAFIQPQTQPQIQTQQPQPQPQIQPQPQPQAQTQPQIQQQPQVQVQTQQPQVQPQYQPNPQAQPVQSNMPTGRKSSHLVLKLVMVLIILVIIGGVGYFAIGQKELAKGLFGKVLSIVPAQTKSTKSAVSTKAAVNSFVEPSFAQYSLKTTAYKPSLPVYQVAISELTNLDNFQKISGNFSSAEETALTSDNFFIEKNNDKFYSTGESAARNDDWTALYKTIGGSEAASQRAPQNSVFITTDFLTHTYHKLIDEEFSSIEETNFYPTLDNLSKSMLQSSATSFASATDQSQKDSYERLSAYFLVTSAILDNASLDYQKFQTQSYIGDSKSDTKSAIIAIANSLAKSDGVSDNAKNIAEQEIGLILDAKDVIASPLMGKYQPDTKEDYTQYGPRSHYTKNVILRDYFRAMMYYGRMNFLLKSPELTRDAANINLLLSSDQLKQWESIYQPTAFFVGQADDLTVYDYGNAEGKTGFNASNNDESALTKLQNELLTYQNPQIMSSVITGDVSGTTKENLQNTTKGFRFMGQRFTPDAFIFSTLTQGGEAPDAKTGQSLPSMPTALMVSTLMGSKESSTLLDAWIKQNAPNSDKVLADRMTTLQDYFSKITQQQWTQNIYWSWLYAIKSLFTDSIDKTGYPMFIKAADWDTKSLQTFLGSWTELKHDTLLYAKQSYADAGAIAMPTPAPTTPKPVPKGYVEPNVEFLDRLIALTNLSDSGLKGFNLLSSDFQSRDAQLLDYLQFYRTIAVAELQNQTVSDSDFEKLRLSAGGLDNILQAPDSQAKLESNARSAVIADVQTDAKDGKILYEADGIPNYIYIAVKDANGTRLTKGLVYSYYEFTGPLAKRYTDQDWQGWSYSSVPQKILMPSWNKALVK